MSDKLYTVDSFKVWIRDERPGDIDVINEVIVSDHYRLRAIAATGWKPKVIFDVGAHIGTFSILAKRWWPEAKVFCFEPNPRSCELLRKNMEFVPGASVFHGAMRYDGLNLLTDGFTATGGGFIANKETFQPTPEHSKGEHYIALAEVETFTIEQILDEFGLHGVDLLKLDCECSEYDILESISDDTASKIDTLLGEYHKGWDRTTELLRRRFPQNRIAGGSDHHEIGPFWSLGPQAKKATI